MLFFFMPLTLPGQVKVTYEQVESKELMDFFRLEGIQYMKLRFTGKELKGKTY